MNKIGKIKPGLFHSYAGLLYNTIAEDGNKTTTEILEIPIYDEEDEDEIGIAEEVLIVPCDCCGQPIAIKLNSNGDIVSIRCNRCQNAPPAT